ncbi:hypothetical protein SO802_033908 [Lithocarpus litseifolius]|uniref:HAT C-terminal dimerisation domain-containing protein n=1 Tax=Lithocarpus litseifolius TaxID=425828 RepID=A0AAW2BFQ9_9ROSI
MVEYLKEFELKKKAEKQRQEEMFSVPSTNSDIQEDEDVQEVFSSGLPKKPVLGKRKGTRPVDNYFASRTTPRAQPGLKSVFQSKENVRQADMAIARWMYDNCISFNAVNSVYYQRMIDAVAAVGPGYKSPSYHAVRVPLLRDQKKEVQLLVDSQRRHWVDTRHSSLINFLVHCPKEMIFVKSVDALEIVKCTKNLFKLFDEVVTWVGPKNIVHMVTDNASNYVSTDEWWKLWGADAPNLQKLAIRILIQTSASSGCERCWSLFDQVHSKRRLEHQRFNDLVFVHHNLRLRHRLYNKKFNFDPIDYASIDKTDFWEKPYLNYEELENAIYEEGAYPASAEPSSNMEDDSNDIEGIDLGTFGQPIGPPLGFSGNDDEHDNFDDFDDL